MILSNFFYWVLLNLFLGNHSELQSDTLRQNQTVNTQRSRRRERLEGETVLLKMYVALNRASLLRHHAAEQCTDDSIDDTAALTDRCKSQLQTAVVGITP